MVLLNYANGRSEEYAILPFQAHTFKKFFCKKKPKLSAGLAYSFSDVLLYLNLFQTSKSSITPYITQVLL